MSLSLLDYARGDPEPAEGSNTAPKTALLRGGFIVLFATSVVQIVNMRQRQSPHRPPHAGQAKLRVVVVEHLQQAVGEEQRGTV